MPRYIEQLNECTDPASADWLWIMDNSAGATDKDRKLSVAKVHLLDADGNKRWADRERTVRGGRNIGDNTATRIATITATTNVEVAIELDLYLRSSIDPGYVMRFERWVFMLCRTAGASTAAASTPLAVFQQATTSVNSGFANIGAAAVTVTVTQGGTWEIFVQSDHTGSSGGTVGVTYRMTIASGATSDALLTVTLDT